MKKYMFMNKYSSEHSVGKMCRVIKASRSGYYKWKLGIVSERTHRREYIKEEIKQVFIKSKNTYGSPRITKELKQQGIKVSRKMVAKLMQEMGLKSKVKKKYKVTTNSSHRYVVAENLLNRNFTVSRKNEVWVSDISYIDTKEGWLYITTVLDLFDRTIVGWAFSNTMYTTETSLAAFKMARMHQPIDVNKPLLFHSDRGIQYACDEFKKLLSQHNNVTQSMSRKGNCWDNAVAESFFKTLKTEHVYHHKYITRKEAAASIFGYIETWYNKHRRHKHLNNLTIFEYEQLIKINNLKNAA
ncbi:MAG: IS3 family transposase [Bacteroidetes bacterium]|nr:IS3 family transposase [Bacteroidota bacterium]